MFGENLLGCCSVFVQVARLLLRFCSSCSVVAQLLIKLLGCCSVSVQVARLLLSFCSSCSVVAQFAQFWSDFYQSCSVFGQLFLQLIVILPQHQLSIYSQSVKYFNKNSNFLLKNSSKLSIFTSYKTRKNFQSHHNH